jgi:hypothetical protein
VLPERPTEPPPPERPTEPPPPPEAVLLLEDDPPPRDAEDALAACAALLLWERNCSILAWFWSFICCEVATDFSHSCLNSSRACFIFSAVSVIPAKV